MPGSRGGVHYRQQYSRCGKSNCRPCTQGRGHGPYWYAYWYEGSRRRSRYIGKVFRPLVEFGMESSRAGRRSLDTGPVTHDPWPEVRESGAVALSAGFDGEYGLGRRALYAPIFRIHMLGRFSVERNDRPLPPGAWRRASARSVFASLLLADHHHVSRDRLATLLFPDIDWHTASARLTGAIWALRRVLEPGLTNGRRSLYLVQEGPLLILRLGADDWVDYLAFRQALAAADIAADPLPHLLSATELYGGELLPDESGLWCESIREQLRERWRHAMLRLAEVQIAGRQVDAAIGTLDRLLAAEPTHEEATRRLIGVLMDQGQRPQAQRMIGRYQAAVEEDSAEGPSAEIMALAVSLQSGDWFPARSSPAWSSPALSGSPPVLVGRRDESRRCHSALQAVRSGHGRTILISGDAGAGKSALADEVATMAHGLGFVVLVGRAGEDDSASPYAPIAEALQAYIAFRPAALLRRDLLKAEAVVALLPQLSHLVQTCGPLPSLDGRGAEQRQLCHAIRALLASLTAHRPALLLLENLQWADRQTLDLLTFLISQIGDLHLLVLCTLRNGYPYGDRISHLLRARPRGGLVDHLPLSAFTRDEVRMLVDRQPGMALNTIQITALHLSCAGNPLLVGELLALHQESDAAALDRVLAGTQPLPAAIRQALAERLDRLTPTTRRLLHAGAVLGGEILALDVLARLAAQEGIALEEALDEAEAAGLVCASSPHPAAGYMLAPPLLRHALCQELLPMRRRRLLAYLATLQTQEVP
jgi:DNA-binding SARP family transcriptional activator